MLLHKGHYGGFASLCGTHSEAAHSRASVTIDTEIKIKKTTDETQVTYRKQNVDHDVNNMSAFSNRVCAVTAKYVVWPGVLAIPNDVCLSCLLLSRQ
jgi:hypothetical protein